MESRFALGNCSLDAQALVGARERKKTVGWRMTTRSRAQLRVGGAAGGRGACLSGQEVAAIGKSCQVYGGNSKGARMLSVRRQLEGDLRGGGGCGLAGGRWPVRKGRKSGQLGWSPEIVVGGGQSYRQGANAPAVGRRFVRFVWVLWVDGRTQEGRVMPIDMLWF